jgi:hypothetical protein
MVNSVVVLSQYDDVSLVPTRSWSIDATGHVVP